MPKRTDIKKILIIGSGPIVISQACEFDYSGVQAVKALKEEGYEVVLINSNPATIMTDPGLADRTFGLMKKAYLTGLDIRREGAAALDLCSVAAGRAGVYFELGLSLWDYAAGKLLVEEAGGLCRTLTGAPLPMDASRPSIVAGGEAAVADFLRLAAGTS